eukprot:CAMPEP_0168564432 /NCGR_PEP_ID=MMETSP0413-20121227/13246_1 /TAXON_ID=136452 /ORGANISM="Filamoeba nolandi, Strain NC-AS-23-1" /LENGTH=1024 /DNA_ID=CAMNT_0008596111 /DNA_START=188 /DNA_END=3258 /DNA_ORIENTATION=-
MDNKGTPNRTVSNTSITLSSPETSPANAAKSSKNKKKREKRKAKKAQARLHGKDYSSSASSSLDNLSGLVKSPQTESDLSEDEDHKEEEHATSAPVLREIQPTPSMENIDIKITKHDETIQISIEEQQLPQQPSDSTSSPDSEEQKEPVLRKSFSLDRPPVIPTSTTGGASTDSTVTSSSSSSSSTTTSSTITSTASTPNATVAKKTKRRTRRLPADPQELQRVLEEEARLLEEEQKLLEMEQLVEEEAKALENEIAHQPHEVAQNTSTTTTSMAPPSSAFRATSPSKQRGENLAGRQRSGAQQEDAAPSRVTFASSVDLDERKKKDKEKDKEKDGKESKEKKGKLSTRLRSLSESHDSVLDLTKEKDSKESKESKESKDSKKSGKRTRSNSSENAEETAKKTIKKDVVAIRQMLASLSRDQLTDMILEYVFDEKDEVKYQRFLKDLAKKSKRSVSNGAAPLTPNEKLNGVLLPLCEGKPFCILIPYKSKMGGESLETEQQSVFFRGKDCSIHMLCSFDDVNWTHWNIHEIIQKNKDISAAGDPVAYFKKTAKGTELTVFVTYRGNDECIHQLRGKSAVPGEISWTHKNLTRAILKKKTDTESKSDAPAATEPEPSKKIQITHADQSARKLTKKATLADINQATKPVAASSSNPEEQEKKRTNIVKEVHQTELHYVEALRAVMKVFVNPLYESRVIPPEKVNRIFGGVERLINYHEHFFKAMTERVNNWSPIQLFGDLFVKEADFLVTYSNYVNNYNGAIETLKKELSENSQFHAFIKKAEQDPLCNMQDVEGFLIQPIQRIPRYRLLLEDLRKHTDPTHPDYEDLNKSVTKIKAITKYINEQKRAVENALIVEKIQATLTGKPVELRGRHFIREGTLEVQLQNSKAKPQQKFFFLFNNLMLMCEEKKKKSKELSQYVVEYIVPFDKILLSNAVENNQVFNLVTDDNKLYITSALTAKDKDAWVKAILDAIESTQEAEAMKKFTQLSKEISESVITKPIKGTVANQDVLSKRKSVALAQVFSET